MILKAFTGGAGSGKTFNLMRCLGARCAEAPLEAGQKLLALTFMHGSRRRLDTKLGALDLNGTKYHCTVIDRFAAMTLHRWRSLAATMGIEARTANDYDGRCADVARLIAEEPVAKWLSAEYPVVAIDEAQDLGRERLDIVAALSSVSDIYAAADEFQCLTPALRPSPAIAWLANNADIVELVDVQRTNKTGLLTAAHAIRSGKACPERGVGFDVYASSKGVNIAAFFLALALGTHARDDVAVITPSMSKTVLSMIERVGSAPIGQKRSFGPFQIKLEASPEVEAQQVIDAAALTGTTAIDAACRRLTEVSDAPAINQLVRKLRRRESVCGKTDIEASEAADLIRHYLSETARFRVHQERGIRAMTVHQAKNREFDGVVVIWPYEVKGDDEHKRRLLYNAVTRAKSWCAVVCVSEKILDAPPFQ